MNKFYEFLDKHCYAFTLVMFLLFIGVSTFGTIMKINSIILQILIFAVAGITGFLSLGGICSIFAGEIEKQNCNKCQMRVIEIETVGFFSDNYKIYEKLDCPEEETIKYQLKHMLDMITFVCDGVHVSIPRKRISKVFAYEDDSLEWTYSSFPLH